jgi:predicted MFS family arabinose efflux permease
MYYNQPLLNDMSRSFGTSQGATGVVAVATQVGYAAGLLFFVPLGDVLERRSLIVRMFAFISIVMLAAAFSPSLHWLILASIFIGLASSVTHIVLPIAPDLADDENRGRAIGIVMTGLLLGILLARTAAGWLSHLVTWRGVFVTAAVANAIFVPLVLKLMPELPPKREVRYGDALRSLITLVRTQPILREASVLGACIFGAFSAFWTTLAFLLASPHYHLGAGVAGSFGILGASGVLIAPVAGRLSDTRGSRSVITLALVFMATGFVAFWWGGRNILGLILGVVLVDMGVQCNQIANQTRIFGLVPDARSRLNTVYMTIYFAGASLGSALATLAWEHAGWNGVCALGMAMIALAALRHLTGNREPQPQLPASTIKGEVLETP